jgi:hypothetical protein
VALRSELQSIFDAIMKAHPDGLTLDELSEELSAKPVTYADIDEIIGALEDAGVDLDSKETPARPEDLTLVLGVVRAFAAETGKRPSADQIAERTGMTPSAVRRALQLGRAAGEGRE